jgi:SAM-dependent methyltransferase
VSTPSLLPPAVRAFNARADQFDGRYGSWLSVAAQRRAVQRYLVQTFEPGSRLLELGGGTGEDALFLLERGYHVTFTDGSPRMLELAAAKIERAGFADRADIQQVVLESIGDLAARTRAPYDGAYSNFAALNCLPDPSILATPLAHLLRPGAACMLVVFGPGSVGEVVVELMRRDPRAAIRRFRRGAAPARLGGEHFHVWYPSPADFARALSPYFKLRRVRGIGVTVPPSAAEPWISRFPRLIRALEAADRVLSAPLAYLADHVLLQFERTSHPAD